MLDYSNIEKEVNELLSDFDNLDVEQLTKLLSAVGVLHSFYTLQTNNSIGIFNKIQANLIQKSQESDQK